MDDNSSVGQLAMLRMIQDKMNQPGLAPEGTIQRVAEDLAGKALPGADLNVKANPSVSAKVAQAYAQMKHDPQNPAVQKAYQALIDETAQQYEAIQKQGLNISKIAEGAPNPYKTSADLVNDVTKNKHISYFPTELGYGSSGIDDVNGHPLLKPSKVIGPDGKPMLANDLFRVVHDYFGHAKDGNKFGATGEERAYLEHKKLYSPEAQKALASETRGQNSWVNYGPQGEANRANPGATTYAEQKAGLLPEWATKHVDEIDSPIKYKAKALAKLAGKSILPVAALAAPLTAHSADQGLMEFVVPGGTPSAGQSNEEERQMLAEIDAQKNYQNSPAGMDKQNQGLRHNLLRSIAGKLEK